MATKESEVRQRIISVAARLFYTQGYNNTGINQVIEEAEIAKASLYHHFKSKTELLQTYLTMQHERWFAGLEELIAGKKDPKERILLIFEYRLKRQTTLEFGGCPFVKASNEATIDDKAVYELVNKHKTQLKNLLLSLVKQFPSRPSVKDATMLAETLFLIMEGASTIASFQKKKDALANARSIAARLLAQA